MKSPILSLCQTDPHFVWIACEDGSIAVCDINACNITKYSSYDELKEHSQLLKCMRVVDDNKIVVIAYYDGLLAFVANDSLQTIAPQSALLQSIDRVMSSDKPSVVTKQLENIQSLNAIEIVDEQFVWCGCNNGIIYVVQSTPISWDENFRHHNLSETEITPINVASFSEQLNDDDDIVQLKSAFNSSLQRTIVYGLHKTSAQKSFLISCWNTDQTLKGVIRMNEEGNLK